MDLKLLLRGLWDRIGGWSLVALGAFLLLLGWLGVSRTAFPSEQLPYVISGGLGGLAFIGIGATLLLSADLRDEWRKLDNLEELLDGLRRAEDVQASASSSDDEQPIVIVNGEDAPDRGGRRRPLKSARN